MNAWTVSDHTGWPLDHLVVRRYMPEERRLSTLVRSGAEIGDRLRDVAAGGLCTRSEASDQALAEATRDAVQANWEASFDQVRGFAGTIVDLADFERVRALCLTYLGGRGPLFDDRIAIGQVREIHGGLRADGIFLVEDGAHILDCLQLDDRLRSGDVQLDAASLAMDLERLGAPELGHRFLGWYEELWGHGWPGSLAHHYVAWPGPSGSGRRAAQPGALPPGAGGRRLPGAAGPRSDRCRAGRVGHPRCILGRHALAPGGGRDGTHHQQRAG